MANIRKSEINTGRGLRLGVLSLVALAPLCLPLLKRQEKPIEKRLPRAIPVDIRDFCPPFDHQSYITNIFTNEIGNEKKLLVDSILNSNQTLKLGDNHEACKTLNIIFKLEITDTFTTNLKNKLTLFQRAYELNETGELDRDTLTQLIKSQLVIPDSTTLAIGKNFFTQVYDINNPENCVRILANHLGGNQAGTHIIENALIYHGVYNKVIDGCLNFIKDRRISPISVDFVRHLNSVKEALGLGIEQPLFFSQKTLDDLITNYKSPYDTNRAAVIMTGYDWNNAFYRSNSIETIVNFCLANQINVRPISMYDDRKFEGKCNSSLQRLKSKDKIVLTVISLHGNKELMAGGLDNTEESLITLDDTDIWKVLNNNSSNASCVSLACSSGFGGRKETNFATFSFERCNNFSTVVAPQVSSFCSVSKQRTDLQFTETFIPIDGTTGLYIRYNFDEYKQAAAICLRRQPTNSKS